MKYLKIQLLFFCFYACGSDSSNQSNQTTTVTDIDGNIYNTIVIGNQTWMKENLKVSKYRN
jgi:hypothetical protein